MPRKLYINQTDWLPNEQTELSSTKLPCTSINSVQNSQILEKGWKINNLVFKTSTFFQQDFSMRSAKFNSILTSKLNKYYNGKILKNKKIK